MTDDREFDRIIEEDLTALPLPDHETEEITPWRRSMERIVWGLGLTTCTLNVLYLNYLLPALGVVLLWLGFRTLRKENHYFTVCWIISLYGVASKFGELVGNATVWRTQAEAPDWGWITLAIPLIQLLCLWRGIRVVRRKAGQPDEAGPVVGLMVWYGVLCALALLGAQGWLLGVPLLIAYICILRGLAKLPALMDEAGYQVNTAPVRISDRTIWIGWFAALLICIPIAGLLFGHYPMDWKPVEAGEQAGLEEVRANLLDLGFPEAVLDDLSADDLRALEGAETVTVDVSEHPFNDGREVTETWGGHTQVHTEYDVKELKLTSIAVGLPGDNWRVIHHFLWQEDSPLRGSTECIHLWTAGRLGKDGFRLAEAFSGRVLYDDGGTTYVADYYSLQTEDYLANSVFFGTSSGSDPFALFSLPRRGERCRGYVSYGMEQILPEYLLDGWINYTHQTRFLNYPLMTAQQYSLSGMWGGGAFDTAQAAIQFIPGAEEG
ncbi:MAG: hypothetical protein VB071_09650 [Lawsonibacter sp.]|nr:hypothetical protein [Lawsonibacter sp.]